MERSTFTPVEQDPQELNSLEDSFEYKLLSGHNRTDGSFKSTEELKTEYVRLTDGLVHQMTHGVEVVNHDTGEKELRRPDYVVWLDKSARPLSWLTRDLWPTLAVEPDGTVPKMPESRFVNIDREQWLSTIDPLDEGTTDVGRVHTSIIRSLRSIFLKPQNNMPESLEDPRIDRMSSVFDDKTVLIVDEVRATGRTLEIAKNFFERAFPQANIAATHWMGGIAIKGEATGNADLPVWYRSDTMLGRGVSDRDYALSKSSKNRTQRLGAWFLSTPLRQHDSSSTQLRQELHQLADDVREHKVLVVPAKERDTDDAIERAQRMNDMTIDQYRTARGTQTHN